MSVTVVRTILANRIWELIEANATVAAAVRVGNRAKLSTARGWLKALMGNKAPGDFPQLIVSYGPWYYDSFSRTPRYSHRTTPNPSGEGKELGQAIRITATYRDARADVNDPVDIAVIEAVEAGGEGLGLMPATLPYCGRGSRPARAYRPARRPQRRVEVAGEGRQGPYGRISPRTDVVHQPWPHNQGRDGTGRPNPPEQPEDGRHPGRTAGPRVRRHPGIYYARGQQRRRRVAGGLEAAGGRAARLADGRRGPG
jgi:hypothetical protein